MTDYVEEKRKIEAAKSHEARAHTATEIESDLFWVDDYVFNGEDEVYAGHVEPSKMREAMTWLFYPTEISVLRDLLETGNTREDLERRLMNAQAMASRLRASQRN